MQHCKTGVRCHARGLLGLLVPAVLLLSGCASNKEVQVSGEASAQLNRDSRGKPLSVVVRVYQLKSDQTFNRLSMEALVAVKSDKELLASELLDMREMTLLPGGRVTVSDFVVNPEASHIGLIALFRQPDRHFWRLLFDADAVRSKGLQFMAEDCYLRAVKPPAKLLPGQPKSLQVVCR
ncbi:type VI secretion system lipoprotein TssJ [Pseudogulbenkiania sp. MAI-1]|uniref:type VI secretion system lipoprotein TssJ n=1 Tax=Pseudogulbenkiania sp. MAI-1 TaxID=990370 RepID=UPI00045E5D2C|nr:type VI secretion system lipoprotein TssJ [Pseudogulbenkiania sp. MAI-1]